MSSLFLYQYYVFRNSVLYWYLLIVRLRFCLTKRFVYLNCGCVRFSTLGEGALLDAFGEVCKDTPQMEEQKP